MHTIIVSCCTRSTVMLQKIEQTKSMPIGLNSTTYFTNSEEICTFSMHKNTCQTARTALLVRTLLIVNLLNKLHKRITKIAIFIILPLCLGHTFFSPMPLYCSLLVPQDLTGNAGVGIIPLLIFVPYR